MSPLYPITHIEPYVRPRWWERDVVSPLPTLPVPSGMHKRCTTHIKYTLSCRQFDRLLARSQGRCEACGCPPEESRFGTLAIDHSSKLGYWAVRGLLCTSCNSALNPWSVDIPRFRDYTRNAFYLTLLAEADVSAEHPPEPPRGSVVLDHGGRPWRHESTRSAKGGFAYQWFPRHRRYPQAPEDWAWITEHSGPHQLRLFVDDGSTPELLVKSRGVSSATQWLASIT